MYPPRDSLKAELEEAVTSPHCWLGFTAGVFWACFFGTPLFRCAHRVSSFAQKGRGKRQPPPPSLTLSSGVKATVVKRGATTFRPRGPPPIYNVPFTVIPVYGSL